MDRPRGDLVVVIEDDQRLSAALEVLVRYWGYRCLVARTTREALEATASHASDVCAVIADIEIDVNARADRSARVFTEAAGRAVPVLLTTTDPSVGERSGYVSVLAKPFDPDLVEAWLASHVLPTAKSA